MSPEQEQIREQQKQSWNRFSGGWKKWDRINMDFLAPVGKTIIEQLRIAKDDEVLDFASGTGEPGLTIAALARDGKTTLTDLSQDMLDIARDYAKVRGIGNVDFIACDVCEMPFNANTFDVVTGRFGFMFFPDMQQAANEMCRVLKPGGRFATSFWNGPDKNFWVAATMSTIAKNIELPPPAAGSPGMFRCAAPGLIKDILAKAGFTSIIEKEVPVALKAGTPETYWEMMTEVGAPIVAALSKADAATVQKIKSEVFDLVQQKLGKNDIALPGNATVISAMK